MKKIILISLLLIAMIMPYAYSGAYGALNFGKGLYSAGETVSAQSGGTGGGTTGGGTTGGGGGVPTVVNTDFSIDKSSIKVVLKQGQVKEEKLRVKNIGNSIIDIKAILDDVDKFKIYPEENEIVTTLSPNEEKEIGFVFKAMENEKPDIYPAIIKFKGPSKEKDVSAVIEVDSAEPLFDVDAEVLPASKTVFPGDEVLLEVNLFNVRGFGRVDVIVEYAIKDFNGNVYSMEHETLAVETHAKFTRSILVPSNLVPGTYAASVNVNYADAIGVSSDLFEVQAKSIKLYSIQQDGYRIVLFFVFVALIIAVIIAGYKFGFKKKSKSEVIEVKEFHAEERLQKLAKELEALEDAHKSGYISDESYKKSKERIENEIGKIKK